MNLFLERDEPDSVCTLGDLYIDGLPEACTLELPPRDNQENISCIPAGTYRIILTLSPHFRRITPELLGVPDRKDIRIHPGNWAKDSHGCILVGAVKSADAIYSSEKEFEVLVLKIKEAILLGESVHLTIQDHQPQV